MDSEITLSIPGSKTAPHKESVKAKLAKVAAKLNLKKNFTRAATAVVIGGAVIGAVDGIASCSHNYYQESTVRAVVTDKAVVPSSTTDSDGHTTVTSTYMIYTNEGTFRNDDALISKGKMNSSDVYGAIQKHCTYDFNVYGNRNHFFGTYKNIASIKLVPTAQCPSAPNVG
jgi:hypothetical protein